MVKRKAVRNMPNSSTRLIVLGTAPNVLKAAHIPLISDAVCRQLYKYSTTERMFCAGYREGNIDSCQGDSGGPLVCHINGKLSLALSNVDKSVTNLIWLDFAPTHSI